MIMRRIILLLLSGITAFLPLISVNDGGYEKMTGFSQALYAWKHKEEITATKYIGEVSDERWSAQDEYSLEDTTMLVKEKGEEFVVLNFSDIHVSDYDKRAWMAFFTFATMRRVIERVKPDLITVTGDIVCTDSTIYSIKRFTDFMESFGLPWAPVFGNHDDEGNCDHNYLADIMLKSPHCVLKKGDPSLGVGNYIVNLAYRDGENVDVAHSLIMMFTDTQSTHLLPSQIEWYKWAANGVSEAAGHTVESTVLFHIPVVEYQLAYDAAWDSESKCWRDGYEGSFGEAHEKICCTRDADGNLVNNGFFAAVKSVGTTKNIICGHDHLNNFSILYDGVRLTYALKVGKGSGRRFGQTGGTVLKISSDVVDVSHSYAL